MECELKLSSGCLLVLFLTGVSDMGADTESMLLEILLILRVLRLVKVIGVVERFKVIIVTVWNIKTAITVSVHGWHSRTFPSCLICTTG